MRKLLIVLPLLFLVGCFGDHRERQEPHQENRITPRTYFTEGAVSRDDLEKTVREVHSELQTSNNATQNSISGLGVNVTKLAEKVQGFGGDLARIETSISTNAQLTASVKADLKNEIGEIRNDMRLEIGKMQAQLNALAQAQAQAAVGVNNRMDSMQQTFSAGRDNNTSIINFTKEMQELILRVVTDAYKTLYWTVIGMAALTLKIVIIMSELSRRRSEDRYNKVREDRKEDFATLMQLVERLEKLPLPRKEDQ